MVIIGVFGSICSGKDSFINFCKKNYGFKTMDLFYQRETSLCDNIDGIEFNEKVIISFNKKV